MAGASPVRYRLPAEMRASLKVPFGEVVDEPTLVQQVQAGRLGRPVIAVGDMVAATLIKHGLRPELVIYDLGTLRGPVPPAVQATIETYDVPLVEVDNPAAEITAALEDAVRAALQGESPTKLHVRGEEDLATLPCLAHAPDGGTVIYGMPNRGLVPVPVTPQSRRRAVEILSLMKVGPG